MTKGFARKYWLTINVFVVFTMLSVQSWSQQRPNVIVIMADDMGYSDIGCYGGEIPTPNLDRLAKQGLQLTQFYNGARCCPTRASLLTGLYAHQAGVGFMTEAMQDNAAYQGYLNNQCVTLGEAMQQAGYFTIMTGKWHVGHKPGMRPSDRGFMRSLNAAAGGFYFHNDDKATVFLNGKPATEADGLPATWYSTDLWTDYAMKFIDEAAQSNKPFFLYLAHNAPHFPLHAPKEEVEQFSGKYMKGWKALRQERFERQKQLGLIDASWQLPPMNPLIPDWDTMGLSSKKRYDDMMATYAAVVTHLDKSIGELIEGLKKRNQFDNTIIIFLSDNGGNAEPGIEGIYNGSNPGAANTPLHIGQCWAEVNNTPFWLYKHHTSEGGIATPCIISWPAGMAQSAKGKTSNAVGHIIDIMPTLLQAGGSSYPASYKGNQILPMQGISLLPLITNNNALVRTEPLYWEHEGNRAMRKGNWKIVSNVNEPWQLYNMETDRTELNNLAAKNPQLLGELVADYEKWYGAVHAQPYFTKPKKWQYSIADVVND